VSIDISRPTRSREEKMTASHTLVEDEFASGSECWCCGRVDAPTLMVHLGNHPEVALCRGCARWAAHQAWEIDDRAKTGVLVSMRRRLRTVRQAIVERGWHHSRLFGPPLRWLGDRLP
jgi:hypothetical protein